MDTAASSAWRPDILREARCAASATSRQWMKEIDPLRLLLRVEADKKREIRENVAHQRTIHSYVGERHKMGVLVRGQNIRLNAWAAMKLNRVERHR